LAQPDVPPVVVGSVARQIAPGLWSAGPIHTTRRDGPVKVWNSDELDRFVTEAGADRLAAIWRLLMLTGMRRGELLGLRWSDVDLDARRVRVVQTITRAGHTPTLGHQDPASALGTHCPSRGQLRRWPGAAVLSVGHVREHRHVATSAMR
jgi:integrase